MEQRTLKEQISELAKECESYMDLYFKAQEYPQICAMTYDQFVNWFQALDKGDELLVHDDDYSRVTTKIKIGNTYIEFRKNDKNGKKAI